MRLLRLQLTNFKGIKSFTLTPEGESANIFGDNATGKTTICDALAWLLFGKDSNFKSQFDIKTLDRSGEALHGLSHEVKGAFILESGKTIELAKAFEEKWTKKRGSANSEFTGHTTTYHVDGVPLKEKEYVERVKEIADEDVFKLLTSPSYFAEILKWQDRRNLLLRVCGDVSDSAVIASSKILADLPGILNGRTIEDHKKTVAARKAALNKELDRIPVRIDEVERGLPDVTGIDSVDEGKKLAATNEALAAAEQQHLQVSSGGAVADATVNLREAEAELLAIKNRLTASISFAVEEKKKAIDAHLEKERCALRKARDKSLAGESLQGKIDAAEKRMAFLREEWGRVNAGQHAWHEEAIPEACPTCGQYLPANRIDEARQKAEEARQKSLAVFNTQKAESLEKIDQEGLALKTATEGNRAALVNLASEISMQEEEAKTERLIVDSMNAEIDQLKTDADVYTQTAVYKAAEKIRQGLEAKVAELKGGTQEETMRIGVVIDRLKMDRGEIEERLKKVVGRKNGEARIAELREEQKRLAAEYEQLERELFLLEEFIKAKVNLLEERINSKFKLARFKLFQPQINGGLQECCEVTFQGVPYSSGLNNGARINVGLDIINTLSAHYGVSLPVFVDNAESVTELVPVASQVIRLVVSVRDKALRVEIINDKREAA